MGCLETKFHISLTILIQINQRCVSLIIDKQQTPNFNDKILEETKLFRTLLANRIIRETFNQLYSKISMLTQYTHQILEQNSTNMPIYPSAVLARLIIHAITKLVDLELYKTTQFSLSIPLASTESLIQWVYGDIYENL